MGDVTALVTTNSVFGYTLAMEDTDSATDLVSETSSDKFTSNFSDTKTQSSMENDTWGFSLNGTDFYKIPTKNSPTVLKRVNTLRESDATTVTIGAKIGPTITAGQYQDQLLFTAYTNGAPEPEATTMQDFTCTSLINVNDQAILTDTRDGNRYTVKKLADGNCWMTQNLRIGKEDETITITPEDSNVLANYELPKSKLEDFSGFDESHLYVDENYGGYYNFYTATAGTGGTEITDGETTSSICPKGWRLPTGGDNGEFMTLYNHYNSPELMFGEPALTLSGYVNNRAAYAQGTYGRFWASTIHDYNGDGKYAKALVITQNFVTANSSGQKSGGYAIRCLVDTKNNNDPDPEPEGDPEDDFDDQGNCSTTKTIYDITTMQRMTNCICANTTTPLKTATSIAWNKTSNTSKVPRKVLIDVRDNKKYLISKLADGNCWMSQNLGLDLVAGETLTNKTTDLNTITSWTPTSTTQTEPGEDWSTVRVERSYHPAESESWYRAGTEKSSSPTENSDEYLYESAGNLYNGVAAVAGAVPENTTYDEIEDSICPRGWRIPQERYGKSYHSIFEAYDGKVSTSLSFPINFVMAGFYTHTSNALEAHHTGYVSDQGTRFQYLSSQGVASQLNGSQNYTPYLYYIYAGPGSVRVAGSGSATDMHSFLVYGSGGYSVRCVAR
jgi:uncharacterized protein (TIGR02145 family)